MRWALSLVALAACGAPGTTGGPAPEGYAENCAACHEAGAADAPRRGDEADWARRRRRGLDELTRRAREGTVAMPPRGLCFGCDDAQLDVLVRYVSGWPAE